MKALEDYERKIKTPIEITPRYEIKQTHSVKIKLLTEDIEEFEHKFSHYIHQDQQCIQTPSTQTDQYSSSITGYDDTY